MAKLFTISTEGGGLSFFVGLDMGEYCLEEKVGYIHCCAGLRKARSFSLTPEKTYLIAEIDYLEACPVCGHTVVQLTRIDFNNNIDIIRKINEKARNFFEKIQSSILYEKKTNEIRVRAYSSFYLNYNEFGIKKKCYSNLSTLKIGLFENRDLKSVKELIH